VLSRPDAIELDMLGVAHAAQSVNLARKYGRIEGAPITSMKPYCMPASVDVPQ
jgi:hypothetical protein